MTGRLIDFQGNGQKYNAYLATGETKRPRSAGDPGMVGARGSY